MKTNFHLSLLTIFFSLLWMISYSQKEDQTKTMEIMTSIQCEMCEERIMENLPFEKGIKEIQVNIETKVVSVTYNSEKTTPEKIRTAISKIGYDADDVAADPEAYAKLPKCCQKNGHD